MSLSLEQISARRTIRLSDDAWRAREQAHLSRVRERTEDWLSRATRGEKHPVWDFLFTYYNFSPRKLMTWVPGVMEDSDEGSEAGNVREHAWPELKARDMQQARWIATLCGGIRSRPARFMCHGLHEWAMVYRQSQEQVRHGGHELRLPAGELAAFVESQPLCCTHFDAFRFFTAEARPLNTFQPEFSTRLEMEQGGCLHANMDLYKWASKLWPWAGSDLVADALEVAVAGRVLDMRASPYDLEPLGFKPVRIETEAGRAEYRAAQQDLAAMADPVRRKLQETAMFLAEGAFFPDLRNAQVDA